jgi:hypothetical protein
MPARYTSLQLYIETPFVDSKVELFSPFDQSSSSKGKVAFKIDRGLEDYLASLSEQIQVTNIFSRDITSIDNTRTSFYGVPDNSYLLDDFTRFPVMEEVMREYVYGVYPRKKDGSFYFKVLNLPQNLTMNEDPLVLLDGVPIFDIDQLMSLDPLKIKRIDVIKRRYGYGALVAHGIVSFYSYEGDLAGYELPSSTLQFNYESMQVNKQFFSPNHHESDKRIPDFRNQLYWGETVLHPDTNKVTIDFFTSDIQGTYRIVVHGLSNQGAAGSIEQFFEVR